VAIQGLGLELEPYAAAIALDFDFHGQRACTERLSVSMEEGKGRMTNNVCRQHATHELMWSPRSNVFLYGKPSQARYTI
jgi:hypothetical protein